ncbi:hypothetical protein [Heyndrickxia sporothermodurans]|uniref:hypothetical protein n=1 Tax=Heyndrickxia sporothermodurans TaxID=46224 RepID=UPI000D36C11E|nr:hypothetical protein [Heyndrickxia sporothermodurans]PTY93063.1 hypothetical protein B5V90_02970 [Heyndrickxia sporothermodurans]
MRVFEKDWGREIYFDTIEELLLTIKNDRIKDKVAYKYLSCIPITKPTAFVIRRSHKGFIMGVYRLHDTIPIFPLYEAPKLNHLKIFQGTASWPN